MLSECHKYSKKLILTGGIFLIAGLSGRAAAPLSVNLTSFGTALGKDDTALIQKALDACSAQGKTLHIPAMKGPYRVGPLRIPSRSHVTFAPGTVLQALPGFREFQKLINIVDARDVELSGAGAVLRMNKVEFKRSEYRHCIFISGSTNIEISGLTCMDPGGDGLYISGSENKTFSENVTISGVTVKGSARQGLTIISVRNLFVRKSLFANSSGVMPQSGIDIEPESVHDRLERVRMEENVTESNAGNGIRISLSKLRAESTPISIVIRRHQDRAAGQNGLFATNETDNDAGVLGTVLIDRFSSENARLYGIAFSFWNASGPSAVVQDASILNANQGHATDDNAAVAIIRGGNGVGRLGNIKFQRVSIRDTSKRTALDYYYTFVDYSRKGFNNVLFSQPGVLTGARHDHPLGHFQGQPVDSIEATDESRLADLWRRAEAIRQIKEKTSNLLSNKPSEAN
jgi:hypothetical protein